VNETGQIKRIADERLRIDGYRFMLGAAAFFNSRRFQPDWEWLILSYLSDALSVTGLQAPELAEKLSPPDPDFQTYIRGGESFQRIEVTEVLRPDYRRGAFHREMAQRGQRFYDIPDPHPEPWSSFCQALRNKLRKPYSSSSSLLIYHDMPDSEFPDFSPWHERILGELRSWTSDSETKCDVTKSVYQNIYVVDASGVGAVRLHPHWDIIRESPFPE
jgi:hypothetical protein